MVFALLRSMPSAHAFLSVPSFSPDGSGFVYVQGGYTVTPVSPTLIRMDLVQLGGRGWTNTTIDGTYIFYTEYDVAVNNSQRLPFRGGIPGGSGGVMYDGVYFYPGIRHWFVAGAVGQTVTITEAAYGYDNVYLEEEYDYIQQSASYTFGSLAFSQPPDLSVVRSAPSLASQAADPVSVTTGEFYQNHVDLHVNGPLPIEVRRTYSSRNAATNEFGYGWLSGYPFYLIPSDSSANPATIQAADIDGSVVLFRRQGSTSVWSPAASDNPELINSSGGAGNLLNSTITQSTAGDGTVSYQWQLPDGSLRNYVVRQFPVVATGDTRQRPYLATWADNRGNTLTFNYGANSAVNDYGRINQIQSSNGSSVSFIYDMGQHITQATASDGRTVYYTYNNWSDLTDVQLPDGSKLDYQYGVNGPGSTLNDGSSNHLIVQVTKPDGRILQNAYDVFNRVQQQKATVGQPTPANPNPIPVVTATFDYSVAGQTTVKDAYNHPTVYQYSANNLITTVTDPLNQTITKTWYLPNDSSPGAYPNSLHTVTDQRGLVTTYQYDAQGNITQTQVTGDLTGSGSSVTATTSTIYNSLNLPVTITDASGLTTAFYYADSNYPYLPTKLVTLKNPPTDRNDPNGTPLRTDILTYTAQSDANGFSKGLLLNKTVASGTSDQAVTTYACNSAGFMTQQTQQTGTSDPNVVTNYTPTPHGEVFTVTDADNRSTTYTYDGMSRPLTKTVKDENGTILGSWSTTYTGNGEVSLTTGPRTPADTVQRTYDNDGRLMEEDVALTQAKPDGSGVVASALPATTDYVHDYTGNLVSIVDPLGNATGMTYDANGQMLTRTATGTGTTSLRAEGFTYEPGGKVATYTNPLGGVTNTYYTATGQLRRQENPDGSVLQWRYQTDGRLSQEILRNGATWTTVYDDVNRLVTRTLTNAAGTALAQEISLYDRRGNLIAHQDTDGFVKTMTYDGLDRPKTVTGPPAIPNVSAQQVTAFIYGASAKTLATLNALGEGTLTVSDAIGRPQQVQVFAPGGGTPVRTTTYTYSADHNAVTVQEGTGPVIVTQGTSAGSIIRTAYTDTLGRPVLTVLGDRSFTSNTYDLDGNLLTSTDALGQATGYLYNGLNQPTSQTLPDGTVTGFSWDAAGDPLTRTMANGTLTWTQTWDTAGRKTGESLTAGGTTTRQYSYAYYPASAPAAGLLYTVTGPRDEVKTAYDDFLRPQTITTADVTSGTYPETNGTTIYGYDNRGHITGVASNASGPYTLTTRTYDGYGQILTEKITDGGATTYENETQTWDAAGRRLTLNDASSTLSAPLFAYQHRADGLLTQVTANSQNYNFNYADNGLLVSRVNPFRTLSVDSRDGAGRVLQETNTVSGTAASVENMTWRPDGAPNGYIVAHTGVGVWNESRNYSYNSRNHLTSEGFSPASGQSAALNYTFDGTNPGLGVRLDAKIGTGAPASWERSATADGLGRVTSDNQINASGHAIPASGSATGLGSVNILVDGVPQGLASYAGSTWALNLDLSAGSHTLVANATDPSGLYTSSATSSFTVTAANSSEQTGTVTNFYDGEGNAISRTWANGTIQSLTWDSYNRLIKVSQRDNSHNGYDWTAVYDGLGRRLQTVQQPVVNNVASGSATTISSIYDPQVKFLEIGVAVNGAKAWKIYGGRFSGLQGAGGLESTIVDASRTTKGVISDYFGNNIASISGSTVSWFATRVGTYGPLPGVVAETLTDITRVAEATAWRGRRIDPTGFYYLGSRYYDPAGGRFISVDPLGYAGSRSLYDFADGNPAANFDPDGRCSLRNAYAQEPLMSDPSWLGGNYSDIYDPTNPANLLFGTLAEMGSQFALGGRQIAGQVNQLALGILSAPAEVMTAIGVSEADQQAIGLFQPEFALGELAQASELAGAAEKTTASAQMEFDFTKNLSTNSGLVIGRAADLAEPGTLAEGEYGLSWIDVRNSLGAQANLSVNLSKLQNVMNLGLPIRDASSLLDTGSAYLNGERQLLQSSGWQYEWTPSTGTSRWLPPEK
jgi:RHS repeat-associated protein